MKRIRLLTLLVAALSALVLTGAARLPACAQETPPHIADTAAAPKQSASRSDFTPRIPPQAIAYQRVHRILGLLSLGWELLGLWLFLRLGCAARLRDFVLQRLRLPEPPPDIAPPFRALALYFALFVTLLALWEQPFRLARYAVERHYGFGQQSLPGFFRDQGVTLAFSLLAIPLIWGGWRLLARYPRNWWKLLWMGLVPLLFGLIVLHPVVIAPAYNSYTRMAASPLREKILALAAKSGITASEVFVENASKRTRHVNAYVTGLGPTTRIVLNDTALELLPEDELLAMMGHEMGHYVEGHIWVGFIAGSLGAGVFLGLAALLLPRAADRWRYRWHLRGMCDLAALPLFYLFLSLFLLIQYPVASAISRALERRADAFGLRVTGLNAATARLFVGFAERDYSDPDPPRLLHLWFGTHPTLNERIRFALNYRPPAL